MSASSASASLDKIYERLYNHLPQGAMITSGSFAAGAASGASGILLGVTAVGGALWGATAGAAFYVSYTVTGLFTYDVKIRYLAGAIFALIAAQVITALVGAKVTIAAGLLLGCASVVGTIALFMLQDLLSDCCSNCLPDTKTYSAQYDQRNASTVQANKAEAKL